MTLYPLIPAFAGGCRCLGGFVTLYTACRYGGDPSGVMSGHFCEEAQITALAQIMRGFLEINQKQMINAGLDICATFYNLINVGTYCIDYYNRSDNIDFTNNEKVTERLIPGPDYPWYLSFLYLA
jgi:hypothetical protein